ncbi:acetate--CoA ligase [Bradymonadaceae bacterium TMQ3]|uniref:Acetyl-coenzyme A synthetase n=1 Tax=Lujinxingia sediminis TaxID=2480984 RepID=A0ABY0CQM0_9DELT|nr:acetate--CoA ligase [Lujinxingia sediminis]RDV37869.1 acetate--CoA ligase [Bradymonadaceae bacterium TMQ3]RVU42798.1 acetate--CoA ligase [Lujinxingia sediminis]TXC75349.1 acetate--CoA ligase [Bradymonadales bacterium TMQ1]
MSRSEIESVLKEDRTFEPPAEFAGQANIDAAKLDALYAEAKSDPEGFWARMAREELVWEKPFEKTLSWEPPFARWFEGGELNMSVQCLDRHLTTSRKNKAAIIWEGEPGDKRTLTYQQLHAEVCRFANGLKRLGIGKGDRVAIYMPMVPELAIALLGCARIGAVHSVIFGGFSAAAIRDRVEDAEAKLVITADGGYRRGKVLPLKEQVDAALAEGCPTVEDVVVYKRCGNEVTWFENRDRWWHDVVNDESTHHEAEAFDAEHPLFILYTSGTTGTPKGVVHATAGYALWTKLTTRWIFDLKEEDTYWCTADIGWITGHSYIVYGPLQNGATSLMYEGAPNWPQPDRFWDIIERHAVNIFYTAPTAIRAFMKWGEQWVDRHDLSSLRLLGTVGEPINPEAWMWYHRTIGGERCPIVDTWWQTETGGILISPMPGVTPTKPGSGTRALPGIEVAVVDKDGNEVADNEGGFLVIKRPWPSMLRTVYKNEARFKAGYFGRFEGIYFAGDGARRDEDGYLWIMGRIDDVINVSGHRLGTMEIESALVSHPQVTEAAVVPRPDDIKGQAIVAFVTLEGGEPSDTLAHQLRSELSEHVVQEIGALARPAEIRFTDGLPKTRSGKIMRRLLADIAAGRQSGDTSTLEDASVLDKLRKDNE